ncbi:hypothetical protein PPL_02376 [Heterostelium album PN500]|uniref:Uncharacterized protein n=1 Tax=Heterostelium pallidum (strain ATCC 26659 / Pp 5 / PN500) TaxID=670386 RepID=D3AZJ4_HETP5|nr:hypothetical protein PPL_02376 [Heterostelium album PN500]EFA85373.1 hypothetical protein PPL_02376 [Heterostelium album PN500]|eukprot:XP_020437482.1 hypothetical protein PPL_02376 [Heterostelium album PN500]
MERIVISSAIKLTLEQPMDAQANNQIQNEEIDYVGVHYLQPNDRKPNNQVVPDHNIPREQQNI